MRTHDVLAKFLAISGTALVALPLVAPLLLGLAMVPRFGGVRIDYLMPFEVYPVALVGVAMLVAASLLTRTRRRAVGLSLAAMFGFFALASIAAQVTGIANSVEQLEPWRYILTSGLAAASLAAQAVLVVIGGLLTRDLFAAHDSKSPPLTPVTRM